MQNKLDKKLLKIKKLYKNKLNNKIIFVKKLKKIPERFIKYGKLSNNQINRQYKSNQ